MSRITRWTLPLLAFGVMVALSGVRAIGADEADKAGEKVKVSGVVMSEDGSPVAGARVTLMHASRKPGPDGEKPAPQVADEEKPAEGAKPKPDKMPPVAETMSDKDGKFSLEAPAGKYRLNAMLKGSGRASKNVTLKAGEPMADVELKLKMGGGGGNKKPAAPPAE